MPLSPATRALHQTIIRAIRMALAAWERWLQAQGEIK